LIVQLPGAPNIILFKILQQEKPKFDKLQEEFKCSITFNKQRVVVKGSDLTKVGTEVEKLLDQFKDEILEEFVYDKLRKDIIGKTL